LFAVVALALGLIPPGLLAEHGMPGYGVRPVGEGPIPTNQRFVIHSVNGVSWGLDQLREAKPVARSGRDTIALVIVDAFDDMEGHRVPFEAPGGYGESLIFLAPSRPLAPHATYELDLLAGELGLHDAVWVTGAGPDEESPEWLCAPRVGRELVQWDYSVGGRSLHITPRAGDAEYLVLMAAPRGVGTPRRLIVAVPEAGQCAYVYDWAGEGGRGGYVHPDTGRLYDVRLTVVDGAGNTAVAPGDALPLVWPHHPLPVCASPCPAAEEVGAAGEVGSGLAWTGAPSASARAGTGPYDPDSLVVTAPADTRTGEPFYVEMEAVAATSGNRYRMLGWLSRFADACGELVAPGDALHVGESDDAWDTFSVTLRATDLDGHSQPAPGPALRLAWPPGGWSVCLEEAAD
jgi:hypothetical protein